MTHSLHRFGQYQEMDFVWQVYHAKGINDKNIPEKLRTVMEVVKELGSENWGDVKTGPIVCTSEETIRSRLTVQSRLRGVFTRREQVVRFLRRLKELDLGLSVIIAGELSQVLSACQEAGLTPHTVNYSIGVFGRTDLLPDEEVLGVTSMCGHHMVAAALVERLRERVRRGAVSAEEAGRRLACLCPCGIFNPVRASKLLAGSKGGETGGKKRGSRA
ncbi:MAG: hypothetical protein NZ651_01350 [Candidatus Bipolaricaulota bacterium]|nr:hypothetical protein [Candidatus Bipolaricaulota bacterium]MDW8126413.1 hypothetical protein [Candidatus Bipolaricaulota bacterium]